jgi:hypothetical protein
MFARLSVGLGLSVLVLAGWFCQVNAGNRSSADKRWLAFRKKVLGDHQHFARQFSEWKALLARRQQRLEKGTKKDKEGALIFRDALEHIETSKLQTKIAELTYQLKNTDRYDKKKIDKAYKVSRAVSDELQTLTGILLLDPGVASFRRERLELGVFLTKLQKLIADQKTVRYTTGDGKTGWQRLSRSQMDLARKSSQLSQAIKDRKRIVSKLLQEAAGNQKDAEAQLSKKQNKKALPHQDQALKQLALAQTTFVSFMRDRGEEAVAYLSMTIEERCNHLLTGQRAIRTDTLLIHKAIEKSKEKKPSRANKQSAAQLARKQKTLVTKAMRAIVVLETDGTAIAFAEVFKQVRTDMKTVQKLLAECKVGKEAQVIEQDIIETLEDMIKALKTYRKKQNRKSPRAIPDQQEKPSKEFAQTINRLEKIEDEYLRNVTSELHWFLLPFRQPLILKDLSEEN